MHRHIAFPTDEALSRCHRHGRVLAFRSTNRNYLELARAAAPPVVFVREPQNDILKLLRAHAVLVFFSLHIFYI